MARSENTNYELKARHRRRGRRPGVTIGTLLKSLQDKAAPQEEAPN